MRNNEVHIVCKGDAWMVKIAGQGQQSGKYKTQGEAVEVGRQLARQENKELVIHGADGPIRENDSYGGDSR